MAANPTKLELDEAKRVLVIHWSDEQVLQYPVNTVRDGCPCATCREQKSGSESEQAPNEFALPIITAAEAQPLTYAAIRPVGNYAYNIEFSDGHDSGIFTLEYLHTLGQSS